MDSGKEGNTMYITAVTVTPEVEGKRIPVTGKLCYLEFSFLLKF